MKRFLFTGFLALVLAPGAQAQPAPSFINNGNIITNIPPQIDATNFINNGIFEISLNSITTNEIGAFGSVTLISTFEALEFSDVQNYTNRGTMSCDNGFLFNNEPSGSGTAKRSATFGNSNLGEIMAGSVFSPITEFALFITGTTPELTISATNVVNTGTLDVGVNGLLTVDGQNLYLSKGLLNIEGLSTFSSIFTGTLFFGDSFSLGLFPNYWGLGFETNAIPAANFTLTNASSSFHPVTNSAFQAGSARVAPQNAVGYANVLPWNVTNTLTQVVIVGNANTNVAVNVLFADVIGAELPFQAPVIQWSSTTTNTFGVVTSNTLYLADGFGALTNFQMITNGFTLNNTVPELIPYNYTFSETYPPFSLLSPGNTPYSPALIPSLSETNQYSAYSVNAQAVTFTPDPSLPGQTVTNVPGRIIINADDYLDLTRTTISGPNYLNLNSPNEFVGCTNAQISSPFMDINLGTTNGQMSISNLVAPYIPRLNGPIDCYSARWTNVLASGATNVYHVLFVSSDLAPTALPVVLNCSLRSTNVLISDVLNISNSLLINAESVTITSNTPGGPNLTGQLNLFTPNIVWTNSFPVLSNFTNSGTVTMSNTVYFLGAGQIPYYSSNFTRPYQTFVNHGLISASGIFVWADYFEDSGNNQLTTNFNFNVATNGPIFFSSFGDISIEAETANFANGTLDVALGGDIDIIGGSVTLSNTSLTAYGTLNLVVSNVLTDTGTNFGAISNLTNNIWVFADGINLPLLPTNANRGDLLGTTITNTAPGGREVDILWAGQDRGATAAGFLNNEAIGRLVLNGSNNISTFVFSGPGATNAIYIDQIVLENGATNRGAVNISNQIVPYFTAVDANPGMTVYFADAIDSKGDISEDLNGNYTASGGHIIWVPAYAGFFSSTNITYPSGITYTLNRALVESPDIDSSGTGTNNALNPAPVFESEDIHLSMSFTTNKYPVVSWIALAESPYGVATNILYSSANLLSTNWAPVYTNFSTAGVNQRVYYTNNAPGNGPLYYRVLVEPPQP